MNEETEEIKLEEITFTKPIIMSWEITGGLWCGIKHAIAWLLTPVMLLLSALLKRKIVWYK